jgi:hypothetical protein
MFKNIRSGFKPEPLLIVLDSGPKRFSFKTAFDEGTISNGSQLEPLLIYGPAAIQDEPLLIGRIL